MDRLEEGGKSEDPVTGHEPAVLEVF